MNPIIPIPKCDLSIRPATMSDLPFIDSLQKQHTKQVGWMPTKSLEQKISAGNVLLAEQARDEATGTRVPRRPRDEVEDAGGGSAHSVSSSLRLCVSTPVGYCIGHDQYFKRDDVGIIYQMNVLPGKQRGFVGASLLQAMFDRAAYGCKLFCCWCAQDIEANHFWESMGFVPLAFRAGSSAKRRMHIFWQRRIREGDDSTPYWFPSQTTGGSIREDRLVLPIPPGVHWSDAKPIVLPGEARDQKPEARSQNSGVGGQKALPGPRAKREKIAAARGGVVGFGFIKFTADPKPEAQKPKPEKREKQKNDPKLIAAARELRDRWLEKVNDDPSLLTGSGKYKLTRELPAPPTARPIAMPALPALPAISAAA